MPADSTDPAASDVNAALPTARLGVVSYLNSLPLREGLADVPGWTQMLAVPSKLGDLLDSGEIDVALLPVVDAARRGDAVRFISDGCIASDGETMTVRVFSRIPPEKIERLAADTDSHTSVVLVRLLWQRFYQRDIELIPMDVRHGDHPGEHDAVLLIGDKIVTRRPLGYGFEVDLGAAWKHETGLPMVFAAWVARTSAFDDSGFAAVARKLSAIRDVGVSHAAQIAQREAAAHGWPVDLATYYLTQSLKYRMTERFDEGLKLFLSQAAAAGYVNSAPRGTVAESAPRR